MLERETKYIVCYYTIKLHGAILIVCVSVSVFESVTVTAYTDSDMDAIENMSIVHRTQQSKAEKMELHKKNHRLHHVVNVLSFALLW